ncbi:MAG: alpha/beta hydrolase [Acidimicrobiia bacterium]
MGYDEFGMLHDNAAEVGLPWSGDPVVRRISLAVDGPRRLSALRWGDGDPEVVLLHGGAQNAHTWDTVALALDRPLLAVDLPGHGHSDWRADRAYWPADNATDLAVAIRDWAPNARAVVGMSLGGVSAIALAASAPELVRRLVVVDVTPGVDEEKASPVIAFVAGPESFAGFDEMLERTIAYNPTRSESSLRRGVLHNAHELPDGTWSWRYDRFHLPEGAAAPDFRALWDDVSAIGAPVMLVRGGQSGVVSDADVEEFRRRQPSVRVEIVAGAGHSIQGDRPLELAALIRDFLE